MSKGNGQEVMELSSFPLELQSPDGKTSSKPHKDIIN